MVSFHAPHNSAVQIYDYKEKRARVVFGPDLVPSSRSSQSSSSS